MLLLCLALAACGTDDRGLAAAQRITGPDTVPPIIRPSGTPYLAVVTPFAGMVRGRVDIAGQVPLDSVIRPTVDESVCGVSFVDRSIVRRGASLAGAVVWLEDVRTGKPLPMERRYSVSAERCVLMPRVQAVVAGGTLNVRSQDPLDNRLRLNRHGTVLQVVRHTDFGQVVPVRLPLAVPAMIGITSEVHPWTRGYVAVFDHPYFDVTGVGGGFEMGGVPGGTYRLVAWHERFGRVEQPVTVAGNDTMTVRIELGAEEVDEEPPAVEPAPDSVAPAPVPLSQP